MLRASSSPPHLRACSCVPHQPRLLPSRPCPRSTRSLHRPHRNSTASRWASPPHRRRSSRHRMSSRSSTFSRASRGNARPSCRLSSLRLGQRRGTCCRTALAGGAVVPAARLAGLRPGAGLANTRRSDRSLSSHPRPRHYFISPTLPVASLTTPVTCPSPAPSRPSVLAPCSPTPFPSQPKSHHRPGSPVAIIGNNNRTSCSHKEIC